MLKAMYKKTIRRNLNNALKSTLKVAAMGLLLLSTNNALAKSEHIKTSSTVEKVITVKNEQGQPVKKLIPAIKVLPGEVVQYTNLFENIGNENVDNIGVTYPIPEHTVYVPNTATGKNFSITYSVDGGKHWGAPASLKVKGKDGKTHPATPADYTHIRWGYKASLKPTEIKRVSYQVRLL